MTTVFTSAKVFRGKWNHTDVALKVMKNTEDVAPRAAVRICVPIDETTLTTVQHRPFAVRLKLVFVHSFIYQTPNDIPDVVQTSAPKHPS